jgi:hypothetical protein
MHASDDERVDDARAGTAPGDAAPLFTTRQFALPHADTEFAPTDP